MTPDDNSWLLTTEVTLVPEPHVKRRDQVRVQVITVPADLPLVEDPSWGVNTNRRHPWHDEWLPGLDLSSGERLSWSGAAHFFAGRPEDDLGFLMAQVLERMEGKRDATWEHDLFVALFEKVPIPVLGSPPRDWASLASLISSGGTASVATAVADVEGTGALATLVVSFTTMTVLMNIVAPVTQAVGQGIAHRIGTFLGTPPIPPQAEERAPEPVE